MGRRLGELRAEPWLRPAALDKLDARISTDGTAGDPPMGLLDRFRGKPTQDAFAADLIAAIKAAGSPDEFRYDAAEGAIHQSRSGEPVGQINLVNMFRAYCESEKKDRPEHLRRFARVAMPGNKELPAG